MIFPQALRPASAALFALVLAVLLGSAVGLARAQSPGASPDAGASASEPSPGTISIGLREIPVKHLNDPRARRYIVDHVAPGTTITRRLEVSNHTDATQRIDLYTGPATIESGSFVPAAPRESSSLTRWTSLTPPVLTLAAGESAEVVATIAVPTGSPVGEQYGVIWASHTSAVPGGPAGGAGSLAGFAGSTGSLGSLGGSSDSIGSLGSSSDPAALGVDQIFRVGVRVYLSTGSEQPPDSGFEILDLRPLRDVAGLAAVIATVANIGDRAVDVGGTLELTDGPGGLTTPRIDAETATIAPGQQVDMVFPIGAETGYPEGQWTASAHFVSGTARQTETKEISLPNTDNAAAPTRDRAVTTGRIELIWLGGLALAGVLASALLWWWWRTRRAGIES